MMMAINYWYEFSKIKLQKPVDKLRLIRHFGDAEHFFSVSDHEILCSGIINSFQLRKIRETGFTSDIDDILEREKITLLNINEKSYPLLLRTIYDPPAVLFLKGDESLLQKKMIAVVGARKHCQYAERMCGLISSRLSEKGYVIVSGMASGIDSVAHRNAVNGSTIAVLGFGFNCCYPEENRKLMKEISEHALLISEYSMDGRVERNNFPMRNRIISGLSFATVIIQAALNSGSLITAEFTIENNRELFVLPHDIDCHSEGGNRLIREGACIITDIDGFLEEIKNVENMLKTIYY